MKGTLILTVGLVAMVTLGGCGSNPAGVIAASKVVAPGPDPEKNDLIGVWQMQGGSGSPPLITFKDGGGVEVTEDTDYMTTVTISGDYVVDGNKLTLTAEIADVEPYILERFTTYTYSIDGDALTLTDAHGATRWVRM